MVAPRAGFTLAEVIVSMALLAIAALGIAATALVAVQSFTRAELQQIALREAEWLLDSLLALPTNPAASKSVHTSVISWTASDSAGSIRLTVRTSGRGDVVLTGQR